MKTSILLFLISAVVTNAGMIGYALYLKKDIKAGLRIPFAAFSFETKEPEAQHLKDEAEHRAKTANKENL